MAFPAAPLSANALPTHTISFDLSSSFQLQTTTAGHYYAIGGEVQASPGRPLQPRTSAVLPEKEGQIPHGTVLVSATAVYTDGFNPLISHPVTDTTLSEPPFETEAWFPALPWAINRLGDEARLVVVPAQFQGNQDSGTLRRFTALQFQVHYADSFNTDFSSPVVWMVTGVAVGNQADLQVTAQDSSGVERVLMVYTQTGTNWVSRDLAYNPTLDRWETRLTGLAGPFFYFVQAVDGAGNVTVTSNKGLFFEPIRHNVYLPLVVREH